MSATELTNQAPRTAGRPVAPGPRPWTGDPRTANADDRPRPRQDDPEQLLTLPEVADRLRTSLRFVRRLIAKRRIGFIKVGKFVRIRLGDLDAFLTAGRVEPRPGSRRRP
jgi:excisionase family DNA binding protein